MWSISGFRGTLWFSNCVGRTIDRDTLLADDRIPNDWRSRVPFPGVLGKLVGVDCRHLRRKII